MSEAKHRDTVVIGGSAGALEPLKQIVSSLPADLPAAILVVVHLGATSRSALAPILNRLGGPQAVTPREGDSLRPGYVYVPTPNHHLAIQDGRIGVSTGPRINSARPAIDVLFRSAAKLRGRRVIGVVLSGGLDDGSAGLAAIRAAGGVGIVQAPEDAAVDAMPKNAILVACPEHVLPAALIGSKILEVIGEPISATRTPLNIGGDDMEPVGAKDTPGQVTGITCPECHGSIWLQTGAGGEVALTCRIGHSFSPETFYDTQAHNVEDALWAGVRSLEEQASLSEAMAIRAAKFDDPEAHERFERRRQLAVRNADALRTLIRADGETRADRTSESEPAA